MPDIINVQTPDGWYAVLTGRNVDIYDPQGRFAGRGTWDGSMIADCPADLGSVYDDLDAELRDA